MAANRIEFKRLVGRVGAVLMIGTLTVFTFVGCDKKEQEKANIKPVESVIEFEDKGTPDEVELFDFSKEVETDKAGEGFDIANSEKSVTAEYTVDFCNAANEDITVKGNETIEIPEFEQEKFFDVISRNLPEPLEVKEDGVYYEGALVSNDFEETENEVIAKNVVFDKEESPQVHYVIENNKIVAKEIIVGKGESGIDYVLDKDTLTLKAIRDVLGTDITDLKLNKGNVIGWATEKGSDSAEYNFKDNKNIAADLTLYPVYEQRMVDTDSEGHSLDFDGKIIEIKVENGKLVYVGSADKEINENGELVEKPVEEKNEKQPEKKEEKKTDKKETVSVQPTTAPVVQPTPALEQTASCEVTVTVPAPASTDNSAAAGAAEWGCSAGDSDWDSGFEGETFQDMGWNWE